MPFGRRMMFWNCPVVVFAEAQVPDADLDVVAVENTHDDRLAVVGRQDADAQVEVLAADAGLDPAVLGTPFLGDVDPAHDLEAGDQRAAAAACGGLSRSISTPSIR